MLLNNPKKKMASIIVSKMKPDFVQKMGEDSDDPEIDMDAGKEESPKSYAMEKFKEAFEGGDAEKMAESLEEFIAMCSGDSDDYNGEG